MEHDTEDWLALTSAVGIVAIFLAFLWWVIL